MDDDVIPPLSNQIIQFLLSISSTEHNTSDHQIEYPRSFSQPNPDRDVTHRRHVLRQRLHDLAISTGRRDRILDWAELLLQLEDQSVTFGLQRLEFDETYTVNADDYVDVTAYNSILQGLADGVGTGAGAPPASKAVIESLQTVEVNETVTDICVVCNDGVYNNEEKSIVKRLPCGHLYHGVCITPWLSSRNTCPVCRFEFATDDPEYEERRLQRSVAMGSRVGDGGRV
ncbi:E3 ubiquitin-protein ligase CIP8-like [Bidens hawaiensis]|uniref:E3 ubiquitin-protein ligase CIP8-like n=1 Tax=Bidens hawaiensis TaxID=980011 RepID=UPI00404A2125